MSQIDIRALRNAFGSFPTGVTVVTALRADGRPVGFTANSFTSVSLDPPLLLVCPGKFLSSYETFSTCSRFAVNILAEGQEEVSNLFAGSKGDRFAMAPHDFDDHGVPLIEGAVAQFSCATRQIIPAGDHCILMGEVEDFLHLDRQGLGYVGGQYFSMGLERAAFEGRAENAICGAVIEEGDSVLLEQTAQGLRPLQVSHSQRHQLLDTLHEMFLNKGVTAELGQAYSVFEDKNTQQQHTYFLGRGTLDNPKGDIVAVPIAELPQAHFTTNAIRRMMTRFSQEAQTRTFGLYLGDTEQGAVHDPLERT